MAEPIIINNRPVGRLRASWLLFKETWRFVLLDREMLWAPLILGLVNLVLFGAVLAVMIVAGLFWETEVVAGAEEERMHPLGYALLFLFYVVSALCVAFTQAIVTHISYTRIKGGDATLGDGFRVAWSLFGTLALWAIITSTIGVILNFIAERSQVLGKIVASMFGVGWAVLTYFVVQTIVLRKESAVPAIKTSGRIFRSTWGEMLASNFTLGFVWFVIHLVVLTSFAAILFFLVVIDMMFLVFGLAAVFLVWLVVASLFQSVQSAILRVLLFVYATEDGATITHFDRELLEKMLQRKQPTLSTAAPASDAQVVPPR